MSFRLIPLALALGLILGIPFLLRPADPGRDSAVPHVIIITPHVTQITTEFGEAFSAWHQRTYHAPAAVDWRGPLGTSEIIKLLQSQYAAALARGDIKPDGSALPGSIGYDIMFGGGSFDHGQLKNPKTVQATITIDGKLTTVGVAMSAPAGFSQAQLDEWYGPNKIGAGQLYDPDQYWLGTALSGFGIVYNRDILRRLGLSDPTSFEDLADPRLAGWVALADPRQSGSITTTFDAIISNYKWDKGWRLLREMTANTRYFTNSSTKPPIDISLGEAAIGLAIDFYGRGQAQSITRPGEDPAAVRVGYLDPRGFASIDADPVSILRGAPHPELARRFVEFCLTPEAQALWNYPARAAAAPLPAASTSTPAADPATLGPRQYQLRRMPIRPLFYTPAYAARLIDQVNPFEIASTVAPAGWRSAIGIMMGAFGIDSADQQRAAWAALNRARADAAFPKDVLAEMEAAFYAWPETPLPDGTRLPFTEKNYKAIREAWRTDQRRFEIAYLKFFIAQYQRVIELESARSLAAR